MCERRGRVYLEVVEREAHETPADGNCRGSGSNQQCVKRALQHGTLPPAIVAGLVRHSRRAAPTRRCSRRVRDRVAGPPGRVVRIATTPRLICRARPRDARSCRRGLPALRRASVDAGTTPLQAAPPREPAVLSTRERSGSRQGAVAMARPIQGGIGRRGSDGRGRDARSYSVARADLAGAVAAGRRSSWIGGRRGWRDDP